MAWALLLIGMLMLHLLCLRRSSDLGRAMQRRLRCGLGLVAALITLGSTVPAAAQLTEIFPSLRTLEERVLGLEGQVGQLIQQVQSGAGMGAAAGVQSQQLGAAMADLTDEVRRLTGQVEDMQFALDDLRALQSALLTFEQRLAAVEQRSQEQAQALAQVQQAGSLGSGQATAPAQAGATTPNTAPGSLQGGGNQPLIPQPTVPVLDRGEGPASVSPAGLAAIAATPKDGQAAGGDALSGLIADQGGQGGASQKTLAEANEADRLYQAALDAIKQGQFAGAQPLLQQFIDTYADHPLLQNAQYWMGETYYAQQDYNSAAAYFTRAYRQDDQGPKAPDSLLKLGFSLFALNKSNDGCKVLNALFEKHEAASQDVLSLAASTLSERGC